MLPRNILVFSDGTGNSSGKLFRTNVWRTYQAADLADPQNPNEPRQYAFYDNGVGTAAFRPLAILGGAIGLGLGRNVRDLYAFICRTYGPGDRIYAFGFSRGAFTVRVLIGLIVTQGLVPYDGNEANLRRNVRAAYRAYRRERYGTDRWFVQSVRWLRDKVIASLPGHKAYDKADNIGGPDSEDRITIEFVGLWDTVAAYGLPIDELTRAVDYYIWPLSMPDRDLSPRVKRAMHALSIDDERNTFHPQLWNEAKPGRAWRGTHPPNPATERPNGPEEKGSIQDERLSQVWFAGVHSNVGGGYPDDSLSYVPLDWIMSEAERKGVRFTQRAWSEIRALADENGPIYDSRQGLAGYYRYNPRRIDRLTHTDEVEIARTKVHESVLRRIRVGQDGYAPIVLPPDFAVAKIDGTIVPGDAYLETTLGPQSAYAIEREHVWNWVWWRRVAYFFTLLTLALMPLIWKALEKGACRSAFCFASEPIAAIGSFLPAFASTWLDAFVSRPGEFLVLAILIGLGLWAGSRLEVKIRDAMRAVWYAIPKTTPSRAYAFPAPARPSRLQLSIERARQEPWYRNAFWFLTQKAMPAAFLVAVAYLAYAALAQTTFAIADSVGGVCRTSEPETKVADRAGPIRVETNALCKGTGFVLKRGGTYRVTFAIAAGQPWKDSSINAGPYGVEPETEGSGWMFLATPLRRHLGEPWFKPMARIGARGSDHYALDPMPSLARGWYAAADPSCDCDCAPGAAQTVTFTSEIVARSSGELFLYVNDAVALWPFREVFYQNNKGMACVAVQRLLPHP